nr:hypothetical protein B0A51_15091 [Rachicladosporium sp. CCFEE 5018]
MSTTASPSSSIDASSPFLLRFFSLTHHSPDPSNRTLPQILAWPDTRLESSHDYIQLLFPLPEHSAFASVPIVTQQIAEAFAASDELRVELGRAFGRMMVFYGLKVIVSSTGTTVVTATERVHTSPSRWLSRFNHNHLRITRIIRSLRVLGCGDEAAAFWRFLLESDDVKKAVSARSLMYWKRAAERELHLPPDEDDDEAEGVKWLRDWKVGVSGVKKVQS